MKKIISIILSLSLVLSLLMAMTTFFSLPTSVYAAGVGKVQDVKVVKTTSSSVTLKWKKVNGATGYQVYCSIQKSKNYKKAKAIKKGTALKATIKKLENNKRYYFKVRAVNKTKKGKFSKPITIITKKTEIYNITYELNGGEAENAASYTKEDEIIINAPSRLGYTFDGWTGTGLSALTKDLVIPKGSTGARSYEAHWTADEFSISYTLNGGTASNPTSYTIEDEVVISNPSKAGCTFAGWTGTGLSALTKGLVIPKGSTGAKSYEAHWTADMPTVYSIIYNLNGGNFSDDYPTSYTVNDEVSIPNPQRDNYDFAGWYIKDEYQGKDLVIPKGSTGNREYTAHWYELYTISYDLDGGSLPDDYPTSYTENEEVSIPNPTKKGYTFVGWTGTDLSEPTKELVIPKGSAGHREYEAHWTANQYTVIFDPNAPAHECSGSMGPAIYTYDVSGYLPANKYIRVDCRFICWNTQSDGAGDSYNNEARIKNLAPEREITLYAQWNNGNNCAKFLAGPDLNAKMKQLAGDDSASNRSMNDTITSIQRSKNPAPDGADKIGVGSTNIPIEMWYNNDTNTIYYYSYAPYIYLNEDSSYLFSNLNALTDIDFSGFRTDDTTDMSYMFSDCNAVTSMDLSSFNTAKVTNMSHMFSGCSAVTSLDLTNFNTTNVTDMLFMFNNCRNCTGINVSTFDTQNVTIMNSMFNNCTKIEAIDLSSFNTAKVTEMATMFANCSALTSLDLSRFNTAKVTDMSNMFANCRAMTSLDLSRFNTTKVINMASMFSNCSAMTSLELSSFDTSSVTTMKKMFSKCSAMTSLDLSSFNTSSVTNMEKTFAEMMNLTTIFAGDSFTTQSVTSGDKMFESDSKLIGGNGTPCDGTQNVDYSYARIDGGESPGYFTRKE